MKKIIAGVVTAAAYVGTIVAANEAVVHVGMIHVAPGLLAPAGVYFAGLAFLLRDLTQEALGKWPTLAAIAVGAIVSYALGTGAIALASALAFALSELLDFAVYTPLRERNRLLAVVASNIVGLLADSAVFLWLAFGSLSFFWGQAVGKAWITALFVLLYFAARRRLADA